MRLFTLFIFIFSIAYVQNIFAQTKKNAINIFVEKAQHSPCDVSVSWEDIDSAKLQYLEVQERCIKHLKENPNHTSIFLLRALAELRPDVLQDISKATQAAIYGSLFNKYRCIDNWVQITFVSNTIVIQEKPLAMEMLALQDHILPYLQQGLEDKRPILVLNGMQGGKLPNGVQLEKRDIAYYFINKLKGQNISIPTNANMRKRTIESYAHKVSLR